MTLKKTLMAGAAGAALFAFAAPVATPAEAGSIKNGSVTDLKVYGQVNRNFMVYNDGEETGYRNQDGDNGSTRFGFKFSGKVNEAVSMGGTFEVELQSNDPASLSQSTETGGGSFSHRKSEVYISHKQFGKLILGQQSEISDGMSDGLDLGYAAGAFAGMDTQLLVSGMLLRNDTTTAAVSTVALSDAFSTWDGGREDAIRYNTPNINGLVGSVALLDSGKWGVGAKYNNKFGGVQVRVTAFYENLEAETSKGTRWQLGASVKHDSGISLTGLYGDQDPDTGNNETTYGATLGYTANMNSLGATGLGFHVQGNEDFAGDGYDSIAYGVGFNQQIKSAGANIYGNVMFWDVDAPSTATQLDTLVTFLVGAQVKF